MKFSEQWLRSWVNPSLNSEELAHQLTMSGFEIATILPVAQTFSGVIVGEVVSTAAHPNADRLTLCKVNVGTPERLDIICGAKNVREGLKVAVATIGAELPNDLHIKAAELRGVKSFGMLCSATELGIDQISSGILELPADAPVGADLRQYMNLNDNVLEVELTPNRGDCLSIAGIAREVAALNKLHITSPDFTPAKPRCEDQLPLQVSEPESCPHYVGRVVRNVNCNAATPLWMQQRLQRGNIKSISAVVDITNYVLLELGQPLHAFDLATLKQQIQVRHAAQGEKLRLLDGQELQLSTDDLVIADAETPVALAGVMGGAVTGVSENTRDIFLESAFFLPDKVTLTARKYNLHSESSHRFERGVDPELQLAAIERATKLVLEIAGGEPGPISEARFAEFYEPAKPITLRKSRIEHVLGVAIPDTEVVAILTGLEMEVASVAAGWEVKIPSFRFDVSAEIDLIEELARLYGYDQIPTSLAKGELTAATTSDSVLPLTRIRNLLVDRGFHEVITYSFVDPKLQEILDPENTPIALQNPISSDLAVMRTSLWPGLLKTALYNQSYQQLRLLMFETGDCFRYSHDGALIQRPYLGGLMAGSVYPEQWGISDKSLDFFDVKNIIESLFALNRQQANLDFREGGHVALHPGRSADIYLADKLIGCVGEVSPVKRNELGLKQNTFLFELDLSYVYNGLLVKFNPVSKYQEVRRDLAFVVGVSVPVQEFLTSIRALDDQLLRHVQLFDLYQGEGIEKGKKSVALMLVLQHPTRTLVEKEIDLLLKQIINMVKTKFDAVLRG